MNKKILWITETAVMLALLVALQALTKPMGQFVTGSCVNAVLAVSALVGGLACGLTVAICSPVLAFLLGIAPQILTVPAIMVGNCVFVVVLALMADKSGKNILQQVITWLAAALAKFATLYACVVWLLCGVLSENLIAAGIMKPGLVKQLPAMFSWPQLVTALIGGALALLVAPVLKKALHK